MAGHDSLVTVYPDGARPDGAPEGPAVPATAPAPVAAAWPGPAPRGTPAPAGHIGTPLNPALATQRTAGLGAVKLEVRGS